MPVSLFNRLDLGTSDWLAANVMLHEMREFDWASSSVGPIEGWSDPLKYAARTMLLSSAPMTVLIGREGLVAHNDAVRSMLGSHYYGILGKPVTDILPEASAFYRNSISIAFEGQASSFHDQPLKLQRDGLPSTAWFDLDFTPIADESGIIHGVLLISKETTERILALRDLRRSRERLDVALNAGAIVGTWEIDFTTETVSSDERFARLHGIDPELARNGADKTVFISGIHPDDRDQVMIEFDRAKREGDYRCQHRVVGEGGTRWIVSSGRVIMDQDGQPFSFSGVVVDVSREVEIAAALAETELRFRTYTETLPQIVFSWDSGGRNDYYNQRWREFASLPDGPIEPFKWQEFLHPDDLDRVVKSWQHALETEERYDIECRLLHHSGDYRWGRAIALPIRDPDGRVIRWIGTMTDINEAKLVETERELIARELDHRVKNLFAIVNALINLTQREVHSEQHFADRLRGRLMALNLAHGFIRRGAGRSIAQHTDSSLKELVRRLIAPYDEDGSGRVIIKGADICVDDRAATPLALIFHELATNAAKYGALSTEHGTIRLHCMRSGDTLRLIWKETGGQREVSLEERRGFGSELLTLAVERQLRGSLSREMESEDLVIRMELPLSILLNEAR